MFTTRRRFGGLIWASAAAGIVPAFPAFARGDDDGPPNVFFSPQGRPYRAPAGAPYPVVDWFRDADRNGDGKLDKDEFVADAAAFFDVLDVNSDGVLDAREIGLYEHRIAPEVLGMRVTVYAEGRTVVRPAEPRLWLAQYGSMEGPISNNGHATPDDGLAMPGRPGHGGVPDQGGVLPGDVQPNTPTSPSAGEGLVGAAPYSPIAVPEPVTAADPDYLFDGQVKRKRFLAHAGEIFQRLDPDGSGCLTLARLPRSYVQAQLERRSRRG